MRLLPRISGGVEPREHDLAGVPVVIRRQETATASASKVQMWQFVP